MLVIEDEPHERWPAVVREEIARWVDAPVADRRAEVRAWIDGQLARPESAGQLAAAWLGALLELPPEAMERVIRSALEALVDAGAGTSDRFRSELLRAAELFHLPQTLRLRESFDRVARQLGAEEAWG